MAYDWSTDSSYDVTDHSRLPKWLLWCWKYDIHLNPIHFSRPGIFFMAAATSLLFYRLWPSLTSLWRPCDVIGQLNMVRVSGSCFRHYYVMPLDRCLNFHNPTAGSWDSPSCPLIGQYWPLLWRHRSSKYAQLATPRSFLWYLCLFNSILLGRFVLRDKLLATVNQYILTFFYLFWPSCDVTGQKIRST